MTDHQKDYVSACSLCPVCGVGSSDLVSLRGRDGECLRSVACRSCGLVRVDPLPSRDDLSHYYASEYRLNYKGVREPKLRHVYRAGCLAVQRLKTIQPYIREGPVLDVGSGGGEWVYVLQKAGFDSMGIEADSGYSNFARRELGVKISEVSLWNAEFPVGHFGAVTLFHVLEHLPDPVDCLLRCSKWLKHGGILIVEVPNIASRHQHPHKRFHAAHLFGFTPETLQFAARQASCLPIDMRLDKYERNILAVFCNEPRVNHPAPAVHSEPGQIHTTSLANYYTMPQTYLRFLQRMRQYGDEMKGIWGRKTAREVLDLLLQSRYS